MSRFVSEYINANMGASPKSVLQAQLLRLESFDDITEQFAKDLDKSYTVAIYRFNHALNNGFTLDSAHPLIQTFQDFLSTFLLPTLPAPNVFWAQFNPVTAVELIKESINSLSEYAFDGVIFRQCAIQIAKLLKDTSSLAEKAELTTMLLDILAIYADKATRHESFDDFSIEGVVPPLSQATFKGVRLAN